LGKKERSVVATSNVDRIYNDVKRMATSFKLKPEEKLNEQAMATSLGTSRTPLREALNRLVSEGFLKFQSGRGFYCRSLGAAEILDLYQAREAVECKLVELACECASADDLKMLGEFLEACEGSYHEKMPGAELVLMDEEFHMKIARISNNNELVRILDNLNARMRFVRTIDLEERRVVTPSNHATILEAMKESNIAKAVAQMRSHILRSHEQASNAVRKAYMRIYAPNEAESGKQNQGKKNG
jgi:DNA-binding GntR family transcriptional regulator